MNESLKKFIWKKKFDVSPYTEGEEHWIVMREPDKAEFKILLHIQDSLKTMDDGDLVAEALEEFIKMTSTIIVDHNFYDGENKIASLDIAEFLGSKLDLAAELLGEYMQSLPLLHGSKKKLKS